VLRVDEKLAGISARIPVCHNALAVAYGSGSVWTACGNGTIARVEPATDRVSAVVPVGRLPRGIAVGEGAVWVTID
jgi:streptogramin lyase